MAQVIEMAARGERLSHGDSAPRMSPGSEAGFQKLLESLPDGVLVHSEGRIVYANAFCFRLLAAPREEWLLGKNILEIIHPDYLDAVRRRIWACYSTKEAAPALEAVLVACDGSLVEVESVAIPITWNGRPAIEVAIRDITQRKQTERAAQQGQKRLELAQKAGLRIGFWDWHIATNTVVWSDETYRQFGFTRQTFSGRVEDAVARIHPEDQPRVRRSIQEVLAGNTEYAIQFRVVRPNGSVCWINAQGVMVDNEKTHIVGIVVDITSQRNLEEQFRQAQKMEAVSLLAGGISHDSNNLLSVILGNAELLLETRQSGAQHHYAEEILEATRRAAQLVVQLLSCTRKQVFPPTLLNLNTIVCENAKILRHLTGREVYISTELATDVAPIRADRGAIEQIMFNLATNARDAMPHGGKLIIETKNAALGAEIQARYPYVKPGQYVHLSVTDTGSGMSEELQARVFEPFFTTKPYGEGTGLGLATIYGTVKQSGGYVWISSQPGRGSTFDIYLPQAERDSGYELGVKAGDN